MRVDVLISCSPPALYLRIKSISSVCLLQYAWIGGTILETAYIDIPTTANSMLELVIVRMAVRTAATVPLQGVSFFGNIEGEQMLALNVLANHAIGSESQLRSSDHPGYSNR